MELDITLYPIQRKFVTCKARHKGFIGGIGIGKSRAMCICAFLKAVSNPGTAQVITAPTYPMLHDATMQTFFNDVVPNEMISYYNGTDKECGIRTPTGKVSIIDFRSTTDPNSLRGPNLLAAWMDEASLSPKEAALILMGRLRSGNPAEQQLGVGTTPKGFNWVYDMFGPTNSNSSNEHFYARTKDNIFLPQEYIDDVYRSYSGSFKRQELDGEFVAFEGLIYGDLFNAKTHIGDFYFNETLPVNLAWDFGYPNAEVCLAIQQDAYGNVFVIDEVYHLRTLTEDIVAEVKSKPWFENVNDCICDEARPDLIQRLCLLGLPARPSKKGKINDGIKVIRHLLSPSPVTKEPMFHVSKKCEELVKEFGLWRWSDKKTEGDEWIERPVDAYNHCLDALRYWVTLKWLQPVDSKPKTLNKPKRRIMAYQLL